MEEEGESYLDQLLNSITPTDEELPGTILDESGPEPSSEDGEESKVDDFLQEISDTPRQEEEPFALEEQPEEAEAQEQIEEPEEADKPEEGEPDEPNMPETDIVGPELDKTEPEETIDEVLDDDLAEGEDLTELLGMLAEHYDEEQENQEEIKKDMVEETMSDSGVGMDDVFGDALSAVSYMGNDEETPQLMSEEQVEETIDDKEKEEKPHQKKSLRERFFNNIIDDKAIEEQEKEFEQEAKSEEEKAALAEQKKEKAKQEKEEKEQKKQEDKEKKEADKAAKAEEKQRIKAEKAAKKQLAAEEAAREVVGRINPVGAAIVLVFFAFIGVLTVFGTKAVSYRSSISDAQAYFETGNYERAYKALAGLSLSDSDQPLYDKARICAKLSTQSKACDNYLEMGRELEALDALIKGVKEYDKNLDSTEKLQIKDKSDALLEKISSKLLEEFHMTTAEARQILEVKTSQEYTARLQQEVASYTN